MRHLVLYKLAGFLLADWHGMGGGLCPQKSAHFCAQFDRNWSKMHTFRVINAKKGGFLHGGGAAFWQPQKWGFLPNSRRRVATREGTRFFVKTENRLSRRIDSPRKI